MTIENNVLRGSLVPDDPGRDTLGTPGRPFKSLDVGTIRGTINDASSLGGATFAAPGAIGGTTPAPGAFTTLSATGQITSTLADGTAPLVVTSGTVVTNLNASKLGGATFAAPGAIGGTTPAAGSFTTLSGSTSVDTPLYKAGGTSGVAGPTSLTAITGITVKGGIITAIAGT